MRSTLILISCFIVALTEIATANRERPWRRRHQTSQNCPAIECDRPTRGVCPYGPLTDENNCPLCECRPNPRCTGPRPTCANHCEHGFVIGPNGCPTCGCFDPPTAGQLPAPAADVVVATATGDQIQQLPVARPGHHRAVAAAPAVPALHSADSSGTPSPPLCAMCMKYCPTGMRMGDDGCPLCACNDEPQPGTEAPVTVAPGRRQGGRGGRGGRPARRRGQQDCMRPVCGMYCVNGYRRDEQGCTLCECHQPGDTALPIPTHPAIQCPTMHCHSRKNCAFGFAIDQSTGCPSCACRPRAKK